MMKERLRDILKKHIKDEALLTEMTDASTLAGDLCLSSLERMLIICDIEEAFNITISVEDLPLFITVGDMVNYLKGRI